ncbi:MAG: DUF5916 domain-containing protein [Gemmatimonadaceae bacterium]
MPNESAAAQRARPDSLRPAQVRQSSERMRLDGRFDEAAWAVADSITDFTQKDPAEGTPSTERTVVRFVAAPDGLWIGVWAFDRDPGGIRHAQLRRDASLWSDDYVTVAIDAQRDQRSGFLFSVNPNGALHDAEIVSFEAQNDEWDGVWDARAHIGDEGWTAEIFLPWQTLRYPPDATEWGLNVQRFMRGKNETVLWRGWRRQEGIRFLERQGTLAGIPPLPGRALAEVRPYAASTFRLAEREYDDAGGDSVVQRAGTQLEVGGDAKFALSNTLTLDVTVNTDFAQAEVDRQIVNLTRFPVFFPETRQFFTEGAGIFEFGGRDTRLFYSRRIGRGEDGDAIPILAGARLNGRVGDQQIGVLAVRTGGSDGATDVVTRIKRDVLGRGYVGAMLTAQDRGARPASMSGGLDINLPYIVGGQNLVFVASTAVHRDSAGAGVARYARVLVDYPNDNADVVLRYERVGRGFNPVLGFVQQASVESFGGRIQLSPRPERWGIRQFDFVPGSWEVVRRLGGRLDNARLEIQPLGINFESGDQFEFNLQRRWDSPPEDFEIFPGSDISAGRYSWNRVEVQLEGSNARTYVPNLTLSAGDFYDGTSREVEASLQTRLEPHLLASVEYELSSIRRGGAGFDARVARFRVDYATSARLNSTLFWQYDNESRRIATNARLRWTRSPGSDLYVVWNSAWQSGFDDGIAWRRPQRGSLIVKYIQYFRF